MCPVPAHPRYENPIELAPGFDPEALAEAAAPVEGVRPWQWLADPDIPDDERVRYLVSHVRGYGTVDPADRDLALQPRARREVVGGHLTQHVFFDLPGTPGHRVRLSAARAKGGDPKTGLEPNADLTADARALAEVAGPGAGFPFTGPVAIVGTTPPSAAAASTVGRRVAEELCDFLAGRGIESWPAVAVAANRQWVDHVLLVARVDPGTVLTAAAAHAQPFLSLWRADPSHRVGIVEVVDLADPLAARVVARGPAELRWAGLRTCPLIPGSACGDLCEQYGGPWVSRSITAATRWEARRARMIRALGCDTCGDGAIKVFAKQVYGPRRQGIPIRPDASTPTRHDRPAAADPDRE